MEGATNPDRISRGISSTTLLPIPGNVTLRCKEFWDIDVSAWLQMKKSLLTYCLKIGVSKDGEQLNSMVESIVVTCFQVPNLLLLGEGIHFFSKVVTTSPWPKGSADRPISPTYAIVSESLTSQPSAIKCTPRRSENVTALGNRGGSGKTS